MIKDPDAISKQIPAFIVRYEDLRVDPVPILKDMFKFLFDVKSIEGTVLEKRITEKCGSKSQPKSIYKAKPGGFSVNRNKHCFNEP